jgi:dihydrofolate reductase
MRKLITAAFVSLDGVMQAPGGPHEDPTGGFEHGGWVVPYADEGFGKEIDDLFFSRDCELLLGRKTYEIFAAYWPYYQGEDQDGGIANLFNSITKYVATRSGEVDTGWEKTVVLRDAAADVAKLKQTEGPDLITQGSANLIQTLLAHDLIDELRVQTFPIVLGKGKKLLGEGAHPAALKLTHSATTESGITIARAFVAGDVKTGDYGLVEATPAEHKRRARMKREG